MQYFLSLVRGIFLYPYNYIPTSLVNFLFKLIMKKQIDFFVFKQEHVGVLDSEKLHGLVNMSSSDMFCQFHFVYMCCVLWSHYFRYIFREQLVGHNFTHLHFERKINIPVPLRSWHLACHFFFTSYSLIISNFNGLNYLK